MTELTIQVQFLFKQQLHALMLATESDYKQNRVLVKANETHLRNAFTTIVAGVITHYQGNIFF